MYINIVRNRHQQFEVFGVDTDRDDATFGVQTFHQHKVEEARAYAQRLARESGTTDIRDPEQQRVEEKFSQPVDATVVVSRVTSDPDQG